MLLVQENGYVTSCDDGEQITGLLEINTCRRTVESQEGVNTPFP